MTVSDLSVSAVRPFLPAKDFALSKRFYAALGWDTRDVGPGLALVRLTADQQVYLQNYYVKELAENTMIHVTVADATAWHEHVSALLRGGDFPEARVQPPTRQAYGAVVTFVHDPAGVLLHLCQWDRSPT
jgi:predicted enzyme related to lactoylglutathione lyase